MSKFDLETRIAEHHDKRPPVSHTRAAGEVGEIVVVVASDGERRRVVLVTGVDSSTATLEISLASNRLEMATDLDLIIDREDSAAPYDLLAQSELYGSIFPEQLDSLIGSISTEIVSALSHALRTDGESLVGMSVGLPLGGVEDPRREFKESELADLLLLVAQCRRWLAGDPAEIVSLDPEVLFPPKLGAPVEEAYEAIGEILDLLDSYESAGHRLSADLRTMFDEASWSEFERWRTEFNFDIWARLQRIGFEESELVDVEETERQRLRVSYLNSHANSGDLVVDLFTTEMFAWPGILLVKDGSGDGRTCRSRALDGAAA